MEWLELRSGKNEGWQDKLRVPPATTESKNTRCAWCGLEEHNFVMQSTLIFARIISFMLFTVLLLLMYFISKNV
jgi:hypothetical protein